MMTKKVSYNCRQALLCTVHDLLGGGEWVTLAVLYSKLTTVGTDIGAGYSRVQLHVYN